MNMSSRRPNIFVTDGNGCIGYPIVREFLQGKHRNNFGGVCTSVFEMQTACDLWELGAFPVELKSERETHDLEMHLKKCDIMILVPNLTNQDMVKWAHTYIQCAKKVGVTHCMLVSVAGIDDANVQVAKEMLQIEQLFKQSGLENTRIVRMGLLQNWIFLWQSDIRMQQILRLPLKKEAKLAPLNICDLTMFITGMCSPEGEMMRTKQQGHVYRLTGPELLDANRLVDMLNKVVGTNIKLEQVDRQHAEQYMHQHLKISKHRIMVILDIFELANHGKLNFVSGDEKKTIGQEPVNVDDFLSHNKGRFLPEQQRM